MISKEQLQAFSISLDYLGRVYLEPPQTSFIAGIVTDDLFSHWPLPVTDKSDSHRGLALLARFSRQWQPSLIDDLSQDYTRLFIGLERTLAPPYESVYLSRDHIIFERQTLEVRDFYKQADLEIPRLHKEPDDHIGYELNFASFLCRQESDSHLETLSLFLESHLLKWAHLFCRRVWDHAAYDYFKGNALLTTGTLESLARLLGVDEYLPDDGNLSV